MDLFAGTFIYLCISSRPRETLLCKERICCTPPGPRSRAATTSLQGAKPPRSPGAGDLPRARPLLRTMLQEAPNPSASPQAEQNAFYKHHHLPALSHLSRKPSSDHLAGGSRWLHTVSLAFHSLCPGGGGGPATCTDLHPPLPSRPSKPSGPHGSRHTVRAPQLDGARRREPRVTIT